MTLAKTASGGLALTARVSVKTARYRHPCEARVAPGGISLDAKRREILMTHEETQIRQIEENIAGLERRIEAMKKHKSSDTNVKIAELDIILSDLRGHLAWHRRRKHE